MQKRGQMEQMHLQGRGGVDPNRLVQMEQQLQNSEERRKEEEKKRAIAEGKHRHLENQLKQQVHFELILNDVLYGKRFKHRMYAKTQCNHHMPQAAKLIFVLVCAVPIQICEHVQGQKGPAVAYAGHFRGKRDAAAGSSSYPQFRHRQQRAQPFGKCRTACGEESMECASARMCACVAPKRLPSCYTCVHVVQLQAIDGPLPDALTGQGQYAAGRQQLMHVPAAGANGMMISPGHMGIPGVCMLGWFLLTTIAPLPLP